MKNTIKFISIGMVMVLLLMSQWSVSKSVEAADVAADDIEWMDATDTVVTHYAPGTGTGTTAAVFYINDTDLGVTQTGSSSWTVADGGANVTIAAGSVMNLANGQDDSAAVAGQTFALGDADYATGNTVNGVIDRGSLYFMLGTADRASTGADRTNGTVTLSAAATITAGAANALVAHYTFKAADTYAASTHRAKVTSTSDSTGEWIQITEVDDEGSSTAAVDSGIFRGAVNIGVDASHATADDGAVWVQDGDTLTVTYYNAIDSSGNDGTAIASTTATIDASDPEIVVTSPSDETLTSETSPTLTFNISDGGSGFSSTLTDYGDHVAVQINGCNVLDSELTLVSHSASAMSFSYTPGIGTAFSDASTPNADCSAAQRTGGGFNVNTTAGPAADGTTRTNDGTEFSWSITAVDLASNSKSTTATDMNVTIDSDAPAASSVTAAKAWDATDKADTDDNSSIKIAFTESLDSSTVSADDFVVSGTGVTDASISTVTVAGDGATTDMYVYLDLAADLAPNATPKVVLSGSITDVAGNELKPTTAETDSDNGGKLMGQATDGVKPTLSGVTRDNSLIDDDGESAFTFASDENLTLASGTLGSNNGCTCGSVTGPGTTAATSQLSASLTGVQEGSATFKESSNTTDGVYGVVFLGRDASNNIGTVGSVKVTNEDVSAAVTSAVAQGAAITITLDNWPLADHDGDGTVADSITAATDDGTAVTLTVTDATASATAESITATADAAIAAGSKLKITYYYVSADHTVEVDKAAPSADATASDGGYNPADGSTTTDATPSFSVTYDEDEFAGDSNTTSTLTSATLTHPDGTVEDILASMTSSDNKSFYYKPGTDLALGDYTIKTKAEDANGNESAETSAKITIEARADTSITMVPGWNLISLPGEPADSDINAVITNAQVQTVLTYDPSVPGGWLTAVRDGDSLVGTLTTIDGSHAYWVQQNNSDAIKVDIPGFSGGVAAAPPAISLVAGWNLVPAINNSSDTDMDADDYFTGLDWARAKGWNANTEAWVDILPSTDNTAISKTNGYWVYLNKEGTLVP